jgi:hypothetical protein
MSTLEQAAEAAKLSVDKVRDNINIGVAGAAPTADVG